MTTAGIRMTLTRELRAMAREIALFPDDALPWKTVPGTTNSAANLALHLCGNLQHYVGHVLGGSPYARNRDHEFAARSGTRAELVREIEKAIAVVDEVLPRLDAGRLAMPYPEKPFGETLTTETFLLHLATHAAFHLGQAGYLRRVLTGKNASSGGMSWKELGAG